MTGRVYLSDDGRSGYHTCGATLLPTVIDRYFVKHRTTPLILTVYSRLDRGDGNGALKGAGGRVLHIVLTAPPAFVDMRLTDALVFHFPSICGSYNSLAIRSYRLVMFLTDLLTELNHHTRTVVPGHTLLADLRLFSRNRRLAADQTFWRFAHLSCRRGSMIDDV